MAAEAAAAAAPVTGIAPVPVNAADRLLTAGRCHGNVDAVITSSAAAATSLNSVIAMVRALSRCHSTRAFSPRLSHFRTVLWTYRQQIMAPF